MLCLGRERELHWNHQKLKMRLLTIKCTSHHSKWLKGDCTTSRQIFQSFRLDFKQLDLFLKSCTKCHHLSCITCPITDYQCSVGHIQSRRAGVEDLMRPMKHLDCLGTNYRHWMHSQYNCNNQESEDLIHCQWNWRSLEMSLKHTAATLHQNLIVEIQIKVYSSLFRQKRCSTLELK